MELYPSTELPTKIGVLKYTVVDADAVSVHCDEAMVNNVSYRISARLRKEGGKWVITDDYIKKNNVWPKSESPTNAARRKIAETLIGCAQQLPAQMFVDYHVIHRKNTLESLNRKRRELVQQLEEIDQQIAALLAQQ